MLVFFRLVPGSVNCWFDHDEWSEIYCYVISLERTGSVCHLVKLLAFIAVDRKIADNVVHDVEVLLFELVKIFLAASDEKNDPLSPCKLWPSSRQWVLLDRQKGSISNRWPPKNRLARWGEIGGVYITNWQIIIFLGKELLSWGQKNNSQQEEKSFCHGCAGFFILNIITNGSLKRDNTFFTQLKQRFEMEC